MSRLLSIFAGCVLQAREKSVSWVRGNVAWALCGLALSAVGEIHPAQHERPVTEAAGIALVPWEKCSVGPLVGLQLVVSLIIAPFVEPLVLQWGAYETTFWHYGFLRALHVQRICHYNSETGALLRTAWLSATGGKQSRNVRGEPITRECAAGHDCPGKSE